MVLQSTRDPPIGDPDGCAIEASPHCWLMGDASLKGKGEDQGFQDTRVDITLG